MAHCERILLVECSSTQLLIPANGFVDYVNIKFVQASIMGIEGSQRLRSPDSAFELTISLA